MRHHAWKVVLLLALALGLSGRAFAQSAQTIWFDPDGAGPATAMEVDTFDWSPGNGLAVGAVPLSPFPGSTTFAFLSHGTLANFERAGSVLTGTGLNTDYEYSLVLGFLESGSGQGSSGVFVLSPGAPNFVEVYYDPARNANMLDGTGFADGVLVIRGEVVDSFGNFSVSNPSGGALDQFPLGQPGNNNYPGVSTVAGTGATDLEIRVTWFNSAFFPGIPPATIWFNASQVVPFRQADPSGRFVGGSLEDGHPIVTPRLGSVNGESGPDLQLQVDGNMSFTLAQLARIGDFVWEDLNANGIQDAGEPGIPGVTVQLYTCADVFVASTTTDSDGYYLFEGLIPGDYYLVFVKPHGYVFSPQDQGGDDELDSDADPTSGSTTCTTLGPGETDLTWDAGLYRPAALGDRVWKDLNGNGLQDAGEPGVAGVTVKLYDCDGNFIGEEVTDADGLYLFSNLVPGSYYAVFALPTSYEFTTQNVGTDEAIDSDADALGMTACVTLASGETNLTVDAGLVAIQYAAIGDFVWEDLNRNGIQDAGEPGVEGVVVELYDCEGNLVASAMTDASGYYLFSNLMPGDYNLKFYAPAGYLFTIPNAPGSTPENDSDADPTTGETDCTTLLAGETDLTWDAGLWQPMPAIDIEKATNGEDADFPTGPYIPVGGPVTWAYVVTNTGNVPLHDVMVTDDQGVAVTCPKTTLAVAEVMTCTASGTAMLGQYQNLGTVVGYDDYGNTVTDVDPSHYYGKMEAPGTGTPGYWKNHPNAWPVNEITIGGVTYSKDMAIGLMGCPDGNKLFTMFRALVAAKLNVVVGNDASCIAGTILAADAWIAKYGPMPTACKGKPEVKASSSAWRIGEPLYWLLDDYNNGLLCAPSRDSMK